ncbi:MAG: CoA-binding protein [Pseudomonadota bacterium]
MYIADHCGRHAALSRLRRRLASLMLRDMAETYPDDFLRGVLEGAKTIVMVGASTNPVRASYFVASYLTARGRRIIPVNPAQAGQELFGETVLAGMADVPGDTAVDMVDIFRRREHVPAIVEQALALFRPELKSIWMQFNIVHDEAAEKARAAGIDVVMDRCPKVEYARLMREIGAVGVPSGVVSSRLTRRI